MPTLVEDGMSPATGETALRRLEKEILRTDAVVDPGLPEPSRYPVPPARPAKAWVSNVGGPWANSWMTVP